MKTSNSLIVFFVFASSSSSHGQFLWDLAPLSQHHCMYKRHFADEDLSIPELSPYPEFHPITSSRYYSPGAPEDDLRSRIFGTFVAKFLACLSLLEFSNV